MTLTLLRYRKIFQDLPSGDVITLDDARARAAMRGCEKAAALLQQEKRRLSRLEKHERLVRKEGYRCIAGVDEVGRGPLAGPLVAAAVVFAKQPWIPLLDDSKKLSEEERESLFGVIHRRAAAVGVGVIPIDELNVTNLHVASLEAMRRALNALGIDPDYVLVDGSHRVPQLACAQKSLVKGDALSMSIAAASIVAKVTRDRYMDQMDAVYPQYGFRQNKGYATAEHTDALKRHGITPIHRLRFATVAAINGPQQLELFD